jgi:hypothetical protein
VSGDGWRGPSWIPGESPGGIGAPEIWIDAGTLDSYRRLASAVSPLMEVLAGNGGSSWVGRLLQFSRYPGTEDGSFTYMIVARRWSAAHNNGQPYYVARHTAQAGEAP